MNTHHLLLACVWFLGWRGTGWDGPRYEAIWLGGDMGWNRPGEEYSLIYGMPPSVQIERTGSSLFVFVSHVSLVADVASCAAIGPSPRSSWRGTAAARRGWGGG